MAAATAYFSGPPAFFAGRGLSRAPFSAAGFRLRMANRFLLGRFFAAGKGAWKTVSGGVRALGADRNMERGIFMKRIFLIVLDSFGVGGAPDAAQFGDEGSDTLRAVAGSEKFFVPNLKKLGLFEIDGTPGPKGGAVAGVFGRLTEKSQGKDTTIGHWEIAGIHSPKPLPVYPQGFPPQLIRAFEEATGRGVLCNRPYSGTQVIADYGEEHLRTGKLIVYTSADSVFQIAAHEKLVPPKQLYEYCRAARKILTGEHSVGRVIARPFDGEAPSFYRTANRHDFSLTPPAPTMLDVLRQAGMDTIGVGKIGDIFAGQGLSESIPTKGNPDGMARTDQLLDRDFRGLAFINLVDFDMLYGHRNDQDGYAAALSDFDRWLGGFLPRLGREDLVMITADHGCDPSTPSTDHSRERVPFLAYGNSVRPNVNLGTRNSFGDIAATVLDGFGLDPKRIFGTSFWPLIKKEEALHELG